MTHPIPNFIIMGAQKSGTTSLHEYLKAHPDIFMSSPIKEPGYFLGDDVIPAFWKRRGLEVASSEELLSRHMLQGYRGQRLFGESSTYYTIGRRSRREGIPARIAQANPHMKFIYMLRDPIDRIRSNYLHSVRRGTTSGSIREFLKNTEGRIAILTSMYHFQLAAYLERFPWSQFHLIFFEEFTRDPAAHLDRVFDFLGVPRIKLQIQFEPHNVSHNRADALSSNDMDFMPGQRASLLKKLGDDVAKLMTISGRSSMPWECAPEAVDSQKTLPR